MPWNDIPVRRMKLRRGHASLKLLDGTIFRKSAACFTDADDVNGYVVFNIRRNRFMLITVIHHAKAATEGHVYIRSFLTHKEYDNPANWDRRFGTK
jgi:mRNA interferase HigB